MGKQQNSGDERLKPPLKWAGGKRWLVDELETLWKPYSRRTYVEPFCGGLSLALALSPQRAILNDINPHAINFYSQLQKGLRITMPMANDKELFYKYREQFNKMVAKSKEDTAKAAALFYYLNRSCFNGLCRFNRKGEFNVPFGKYKTINYKTDFTEFIAPLFHWHFWSLDFEQIKMPATAFIYADPPYDVEFTSYAKEDFKWEDQIRLADWLSKHKGPVVLSNQATDRILDLYKSHKFEIRTLEAPRRISATGDRTKAKEILAIKGF